jgi:hypothetical protein
MSDKQNSIPDGQAPAADDEEPCELNGSASKSYYYDDSTGYEIYQEENVDDEDGDDG